MKSEKKKNEVTSPKEQKQLYGYENYFNLFKKLYEKGKLPNVILLSGQKGLGKATFSYHFMNFMLSCNEDNKYIISGLKINSNNLHYSQILNNIHPNFFLLENKISEESIKIDRVRDLLKFLSKTTYSKNIRVIIIDNAEYLNLSSGNALLKALEEPKNNTFFFIVYNDASKILDTIRSRSIEFKFFFDEAQKKKILEKIISPYKLKINLQSLDKKFYLDSPGNILKYLLIFEEKMINISKEKIPCILHLIDKYRNEKDLESLIFASQFIELHYNELILNDCINIDLYSRNKYKILNLINNTKIFNLDKKNLKIAMQDTLKNETR